VNTIGSSNGTANECVSIQTDIRNGNLLLLLVYTGSGISLLKPHNLDRTVMFDSQWRVQVKSVGGSTIQTMAAVQTVMYERSERIPFAFQLVDKRIDIPCDVIHGGDSFA